MLPGWPPNPRNVAGPSPESPNKTIKQKPPHPVLLFIGTPVLMQQVPKERQRTSRRATRPNAHTPAPQGQALSAPGPGCASCTAPPASSRAHARRRADARWGRSPRWAGSRPGPPRSATGTAGSWTRTAGPWSAGMVSAALQDLGPGGQGGGGLGGAGPPYQGCAHSVLRRKATAPPDSPA